MTRQHFRDALHGKLGLDSLLSALVVLILLFAPCVILLYALGLALTIL